MSGAGLLLAIPRVPSTDSLYAAPMRGQLVVNALVAAGTVITAIVLATASVPAYSGNAQNWHGETLSQYR